MENTMRFVFVWIGMFLAPCISFAQHEKEIDSIQVLLKKSKSLFNENTAQSFEYAKLCEKLYKEAYGKPLLAEIKYSIGSLFYVKADYAQALEYFVDSNELYQEINDTLGLFTSYKSLGLVEMGIENHESSIDYFRKASEFINKEKQPDKCVIDYNIGLNQYQINEIEPALKNFWRASKSAKIYKKYDIEIMTYLKLSEHYLGIDNQDSCFYYLQKVKNHSYKFNSWVHVYLQKGLSKYYLSKGDVKIANELATNALNLAHQIGSKWDIADNLGTLSEIAFQKNDFKNAYLLKKQQEIYNDSINSENKIRQIKYLIYQKKEAENQLLSKTNQTIINRLSTAKTIILVVFILCLSFLVLLFIYRKNLKKKTRFTVELSQKNEKIVLQNSDLEEINNTKTKILSIVSHDMKSPLATIKQVLVMYNEGMLSKEEQDLLLKKLLIQVESSIEMLNNLVFWAKKQAQGIKVNKIAIIPFEILKNIFHHNKVVLELKNIEILFISEGFEKTKAVIDPDQFQIICQNILGNCIKFSHNSSQIIIKFSEDENYLKIHFIDSGIGMTEDKINEILNKNIQLKSESGTNDEKGSGLGLVLVQSLLELNDGLLEIQSQPNEGSEFVVYLSKTCT